MEDGRKQSVINVATGKAEAVSIIAKKEKQANEILNKALQNPAIRNYVLMNQYLETYKDLLQDSHVLVAPKTADGEHSSSALLAMAMLGINNRQPPTFKNLELELK